MKHSIPGILATAMFFSTCGIEPSKPSRSLQPSQELGSSDTCSAPALLLQADGTPTYERDIKPIVIAKCTWCHSPDAKPQDMETPYLNDYVRLKNKATASHEEIDKGSMPPRDVTPQMTAEEKAKFTAWVRGGMLEGEPAAADTGPVPGKVGYDVIQVYLQSQCVGCHASGMQAPDLSTFDGAKAAAAASLADITVGTMPPGAGKATPNNIALLDNWIKNGFLLTSEGQVGNADTTVASIDDQGAQGDCP